MKAVVLGGDGGIGRLLAAALQKDGHDVLTTTRRAGPVSARQLRLDLADPGVAAMPLPAADVVYFCAALARFADCRAHADLARTVNVVAPAVLARRWTAEGARVIFLSTSAVFDGREPQRSAASPVSPRSLYGRLKAEAESAFLDLGASAAVLRLTKLLLPEMPLFGGWIAALGRGEAIEAFSDLHIAPVAPQHMMQALLAVAADKEGGIYQLSGARDISYLAAARYLAKRIGLPASHVASRRAVDGSIPAEEILTFTALDAARLATLTGTAAPDPYTVIDAVYGPALDAARRRQVG